MKLLAIPNDPLSSYVAKGEIKKYILAQEVV